MYSRNSSFRRYQEYIVIDWRKKIMNIYDCKVKKQNGQDISMDEYRGKILLIVNTATGCGFTPQYSELQDIYDEFNADGLEILDFPCNQFANQAPGDDEEIHDFCTGRYGITFPQFAKIDVNGENAIPLYRWLQDNSVFNGFGKSPMSLLIRPIVKKMDKDYKNNSKIKWNFTKFLIDRDGNMIERFEPTQNMNDIVKKIKELL